MSNEGAVFEPGQPGLNSSIMIAPEPTSEATGMAAPGAGQGVLAGNGGVGRKQGLACSLTPKLKDKASILRSS